MPKARMTYKAVKQQKLALKKNPNLGKIECGFVSTKKKIRDSIRQVPRKYRNLVKSKF